ncbi:MAG: nitronate monooxygenase [Myxococcota bacterium]|nr:nitronate monooxygenase [Myxococcota bacterium]
MRPFSTPLSRRIGLRYPLVSAPMFLISNKEMLLAAAEAGILGAMPSLNQRTTEAFVADLTWLQDRTDKPFAINLTIGLTDPARLRQDVEACLDLKVPVLITSYGNPTPIVTAAKKVGTIVLHDVIHLKHAKKAEAAGVDAIIGVSHGAGGHAGRVHPYTLIPWLRENLQVPVVAAGAISTGDNVAAALGLGAELAYMGTRFIASTECGAPERYKALVRDITHEDIVYTDEVSGTHANFIRQTLPAFHEKGTDTKRWKDIWSAGQGVTLIDEVKPMADIVAEVVGEYHAALDRLNATRRD